MKWKRILLLAVNILLLLGFFACLIGSAWLHGLLFSQQAAKRFAGESGQRFAQVSAFLTENSGFDDKSISGLRSGFDAALLTASLEAPEGGKLYTDAWSGHGSIDVVGDHGNATTQAIGVGGDFFLFHPLALRDGGYLAADDLMGDRVVLDEEMAWRLFGSVDLAGLEVRIGGKPYLIAGVVSREDDFASAAAYSGEPGLFMSYEALKELTGAGIDCYELVLADPISGFAAEKLSEGITDPNAVIVENSSRYSLGKRFQLLGEFGKRSMHLDGLQYPYWENAARYTEDWSALLLLLQLILIVCPLICAVVFGVRLLKDLKRKGKTAAKERIEQREARAAERYRQAHPDEYLLAGGMDAELESFPEEDLLPEPEAALPEDYRLPDAEDIVREVLEEQKQAREQEMQE